ncbi:MAG: hypothetical protein ACK526_05725, partial [Planctomyces sp.]
MAAVEPTLISFPRNDLEPLRRENIGLNRILQPVRRELQAGRQIPDSVVIELRVATSDRRCLVVI